MTRADSTLFSTNYHSYVLSKAEAEAEQRVNTIDPGRKRKLASYETQDEQPDGSLIQVGQCVTSSC